MTDIHFALARAQFLSQQHSFYVLLPAQREKSIPGTVCVTELRIYPARLARRYQCADATWGNCGSACAPLSKDVATASYLTDASCRSAQEEAPLKVQCPTYAIKGKSSLSPMGSHNSPSSRSHNNRTFEKRTSQGRSSRGGIRGEN